MTDPSPKLQRAVLYARCSTEEESQKDALQKQVQEGRACIEKKGWFLADIYVEAVSGTVAGKRGEYQRLLRDMKSDRYDIIVIKCLDRLMRETKEWFYFCDKLNQEGKRLYLYLDGRFFEPEEDQANLLSGIEAIMAEQYSRNLSRKINNAHRNRQKSGESVVLTSRTYGYRKENKKVLVDKEQAEAVKKMFCYCREGFGGRLISKMLEEQGYRNLNGKPIGEATIRRIIRNPLYKGVAVMNRLHYDFNRKCLMKNPPENWIFHEGAVPTIVDPVLWDEANRAMDLRSAKAGRKKELRSDTLTASSPFSGKIICGLCKNPYYKCTRRHRQTGKCTTEWKCSRYLSRGRKGLQGGCDNVHIRQEALIKILRENGRKFSDIEMPGKDEIIDQALSVLKHIFGGNNVPGREKMLEGEIEALKQKQARLLDLLLREIVDEGMYIEKNAKLNGSINRRKSELKNLEKQNFKNVGHKERLEVIRQRLTEDIAETAAAYRTADRIGHIEVYPEYIEIWPSGLQKGERKKPHSLRICSVLPPEAGSLREREKKEIMHMMRKNPQITAKEIAEAMNKNFSLVRRRIDRLREENRIRYIGSGGHGYWETKADEN